MDPPVLPCMQLKIGPGLCVFWKQGEELPRLHCGGAAAQQSLNRLPEPQLCKQSIMLNVDSAQRAGVGYRSTAKRAACIWPSVACLLKRGTSGPGSIVVVLHELLSRNAALQVEESWSILTDPGARRGCAGLCVEDICPNAARHALAVGLAFGLGLCVFCEEREGLFRLHCAGAAVQQSINSFPELRSCKQHSPVNTVSGHGST